LQKRLPKPVEEASQNLEFGRGEVLVGLLDDEEALTTGGEVSRMARE